MKANRIIATHFFMAVSFFVSAQSFYSGGKEMSTPEKPVFRSVFTGNGFSKAEDNSFLSAEATVSNSDNVRSSINNTEPGKPNFQSLTTDRDHKEINLSKRITGSSILPAVSGLPYRDLLQRSGDYAFISDLLLRHNNVKMVGSDR